MRLLDLVAIVGFTITPTFSAHFFYFFFLSLLQGTISQDADWSSPSSCETAPVASYRGMSAAAKAAASS
jgi:hypothetical protein